MNRERKREVMGGRGMGKRSWKGDSSSFLISGLPDQTITSVLSEFWLSKDKTSASMRGFKES